jgi:hypothetical protein
MLPQILFTLTALGGAVVASFPLIRGVRPPLWLALGHGGVVVASFVALIYAMMTVGITSLAQAALGVLLLAALGGATLFLGFHLQNKALPKPLVIGHALIALVGVVMLWLGR